MKITKLDMYDTRVNKSVAMNGVNKVLIDDLADADVASIATQLNVSNNEVFVQGYLLLVTDFTTKQSSTFHNRKEMMLEVKDNTRELYPIYRPFG